MAFWKHRRQFGPIYCPPVHYIIKPSNRMSNRNGVSSLCPCCNGTGTVWLPVERPESPPLIPLSGVPCIPPVEVTPGVQLVGYRGVEKYVQEAVDWNTKVAMPQCDLVRQRRGARWPSWRKHLIPRQISIPDLFVHAEDAIKKWFTVRGIEHMWKLSNREQLSHVNTYTLELTYDFSHACCSCCLDAAPCETMFHGTKWYNVANISRQGCLAESNDASLGHDNHGVPGVFVSKHKEVVLGSCYSTPQDLFGQGLYYSCYFTVVVDPARKTYEAPPKKNRWETVFPKDAVQILSLHVRVNPPVNGDRFQGYEPHLESGGPALCTVSGHSLFDAWN